MEPKTVVLIALGSVIGAVILFLAIFVALRGLQSRRAGAVLNKFAGRQVIRVSSNANFFGQESLGMAQLRGNGVLVLTEEELYFEMWLPQRQLSIPLSSIVGIETPRSHLGKTGFRPLFKVTFHSEPGQLDSAAWLLSDVHGWKQSLEDLVQQRF